MKKIDVILLLFVGLKLGGAIDWSWWWVASPLYVDFLAFMVRRYRSEKLWGRLRG